MDTVAVQASCCVGIDVSKDRLDVHVRRSDGCVAGGDVFAVNRDTAGLDELVARLKLLQLQAVAVEASGGFEKLVVASLGAAGLPVLIVNPAQVRAFANAVGQRAKTDTLDAAVIAHFLEAVKPPVRPLPEASGVALGELLARRRQIILMRTAEQHRARQALHKVAHKSIARILKALDSELASLDTEIDEKVRGTPEFVAKEALLSSVPGVGPVIARTLIAEMPELGTLSRREVAALAGLAPFTRQSGKWRGKSFIGGGRRVARAVLYMGAMVAARHNPALKAFYTRLVGAGKAKVAAYVAVARKLLTILNAILRDAKPWNGAVPPAQETIETLTVAGAPA